MFILYKNNKVRIGTKYIDTVNFKYKILKIAGNFPPRRGYFKHSEESKVKIIAKLLKSPGTFGPGGPGTNKGT
jgi:hypothetical protein